MIGLRPVLAKTWFALLYRDGWAGRASVRSRAAPWNAQRADLGRKSRAPTRYAYRIYPSIGEVDPRRWVFASTGRPNLFMDPRFIATAQRSLRAARFWHVVFSTEAGVGVASASLCLYRVDLALLAGKAMHKFLASLRRIYPKFLYVDVMFCGLPISVGGNSLSFAAGCDQECVLDLLETIMGERSCPAAPCPRPRVQGVHFRRMRIDGRTAGARVPASIDAEHESVGRALCRLRRLLRVSALALP